MPSPVRPEYRFRVNVPSATNGAAATSPGPDRGQAQEHVFTLLREVQREFRRQFVQLAGEQGLPFPVAGPCLAVLREIGENPGATLNQVARRTAWPKSRVSVLISSLETQGIVRKDSDSRDSRLVRLHLTPRGARHTAQWSEAAEQVVQDLLEPLSDHDLEVIAEGLAALQRAFRLAENAGSAGEAQAEVRPC